MKEAAAKFADSPLSPFQAQVWAAYHVLGMTKYEVAEILGITLNGVKAALNRIAQKIEVEVSP